MIIVVNTNKPISEETATTIREQLSQYGVQKIKILTNSITIEIPISLQGQVSLDIITGMEEIELNFQ